MSDPTAADIAATMRSELLARLKPIEFDLKADDATGEIELATDGWTLAISAVSVNPVAWVAIDAEPDSPHEYDKAIKDAFRPHELDALRGIDRALEGLLARALVASQDPFSAHIARTLAEPTRG
jgi:hypothetical protein